MIEEHEKAYGKIPETELEPIEKEKPLRRKSPKAYMRNSSVYF